MATNTVATETEALWRPIRVGPVELRNRLVFSAHSTNFAGEEGLVEDRYIGYMRARARGGCGLLTTSATPVHPTGYRTGEFRGFDDAIVPGWERLATAVHEEGGKLFTQLYHCGQQTPGTLQIDNFHAPIGASALPSPIFGRTSAAATEAEIEEFVDAWASTAERAHRAGLDGVELAGAHGYLIAEFLSPLNNRREDRYGGSVENRCRFALEIAAEIRRRLGDQMALGIRFSFDEYVGALGVEPADAERQFDVFRDSGLFDYAFVSGSNYNSLHQLLASRVSGNDRHMVPNARIAKAAAADLRIMVSSSVHSVEKAAAIVAAGDADLVAMVRAQIADPDLARKAQAGEVGEIRRCVGFNQGCVARVFAFQMLACTVNPEAGREVHGSATATATGDPAVVVVVGAGPAGLYAAEAAALRGHRVTLLEREAELGGQLRSAAMLPGRAPWREMIEDLGAAVERLGVDVRLGSEASAEQIAALAPDHVLLATGSSFDRSGASGMLPFRPGIPGLEQTDVVDPIEAIVDPGRCGETVAIVDDSGESLPLGLAQLLAESGRKVTVISSQLTNGFKLIGTMELPWVMPPLAAAGVELISQSFVAAVEPGAVQVASLWGGSEPRRIEAETVILTLERRQRDSLLGELRDGGLRVTAIGDCRSPRDVDSAAYEGAAVAATL
jgi:2,4-dienoyl-CoA reductase-like NADH-dependent reductase (Old Yellow Enzyme family)